MKQSFRNFLSNINYAARNNEKIVISGGTFDAQDIREGLESLQRALVIARCFIREKDKFDNLGTLNPTSLIQQFKEIDKDNK